MSAGSVLAVLGLALGLAAGRAMAVTSHGTATMGVSLAVQATCTISSTPLNFGAYTGVQTDGTATVTSSCNNTVLYNVGLDAGASPGATVTRRKMTGSGGAVLAYALFLDSARNNNWGRTVGVDTMSPTGNGTAQVFIVYGREAAAQYVQPGAYTDTITAIVSY